MKELALQVEYGAGFTVCVLFKKWPFVSNTSQPSPTSYSGL